MTYPCPNCGAPASLESGCPSCGRGPDHDAAEVIRTDAEIGALIAELATAQHTVRDLEIRINQAWQRRHAAAARVRLTAAPKTSNGVQTLLFVLGGLLLGSAAIVFAAVAWSQFGMTGRAVLLAVATLAALAVPPLALRRGLKATAETMAAVGLLLTLLDGYAVWYVNLFGVAATSPARYAGLVFAVTAAIATGYAYFTGLTAPRYAALIAFQPALPLLVAPDHAAGWSLTFGALAALNLAVHNLAGRRLPAAYGFAAVSTVIAFAPAAAAGFRTIETATPFFHAAWQRTVPGSGWQLPASLALVTAALFVTVPTRLRPAALFAGAAAIALALPSGLHLPWWNGPLIDLVVVAAALFLAARRAAPTLHVPAARAAALAAAASPSTPNTAASAVRLATSESLLTFVSQLVAAGLLSLHALLAGFGRPGTAAAVLTTIGLLGAALAYGARSAALKRAGRLTALTTIPATAWTTTAALDLTAIAQVRAVAVAAAAALTLAALVKEWPAMPALVLTLLGVSVAAPAGTALEAYTLSASGLALAAALLARRDHTPSWATYGPSLIIGLLPSLVLVLTHDGGHLRRLLLGIGALAVLLVGAKARLRAPLLAGAGTLALIALHEIGLVWDLIPRWIPLAAGGLLLVVLAATLESRRRDLARFRQALARMS